MELPSRIKFADENLKRAFDNLKESNSEHKQLYEWLREAFESIEKNAFCGIQIKKKQIPKEYYQKYNVTNLWKYNLPDGWRLIYSIESNEFFVVSRVLEWMTHKEYEQRFNY